MAMARHQCNKHIERTGLRCRISTPITQTRCWAHPYKDDPVTEKPEKEKKRKFLNPHFGNEIRNENTEFRSNRAW